MYIGRKIEQVLDTKGKEGRRTEGETKNINTRKVLSHYQFSVRLFDHYTDIVPFRSHAQTSLSQIFQVLLV